MTENTPRKRIVLRPQDGGPGPETVEVDAPEPALSRDPSIRLKQLKRLRHYGLITTAEMRRLLEIPNG